MVLYETNTFVFWDLRAINIFKDSILPSRWEIIRSIIIYALFYRSEDVQDACESGTQLQLRAWPQACAALESVPQLRHLRIFVANPFYLDSKYLAGGRTGLFKALLEFLKGCSHIVTNCAIEVFLPLKRRGAERKASHWSHYAIKDRYLGALEAELRDVGIDTKVLVGDNLSTEEEVDMKKKLQGYE